MKNKEMSFSPWTLVANHPKKQKAWRNQKVRQARMLPQSKDGSVLRLRSRRALSPAPQPQPRRAPSACHPKNARKGAAMG